MQQAAFTIAIMVVAVILYFFRSHRLSRRQRATASDLHQKVLQGAQERRMALQQLISALAALERELKLRNRAALAEEVASLSKGWCALTQDIRASEVLAEQCLFASPASLKTLTRELMKHSLVTLPVFGGLEKRKKAVLNKCAEILSLEELRDFGFDLWALIVEDGV